MSRFYADSVMYEPASLPTLVHRASGGTQSARYAGSARAGLPGGCPAGCSSNAKECGSPGGSVQPAHTPACDQAV